MTSLILLDNEAVQALGAVEDPKHRRVLGYLQVATQRKRRAVPVNLQVPSTVRVEAGWDRTAVSWSFANGLRIADVVLDAAQANTGASIRERTQVSVADAHLGAVIRSSGAEQVTVLTSDPGDARQVAGDRRITVVTI
jgi:predicted nucleic acid-binding protein